MGFGLGDEMRWVSVPGVSALHCIAFVGSITFTFTQYRVRRTETENKDRCIACLGPERRGLAEPKPRITIIHSVRKCVLLPDT